MALRVFIVDDNDQFLVSARELLEREGCEVVGVAETTDTALQAVAALRPDVDLHSPRRGIGRGH